MVGDENFLNKYPDDAAEIASLVRRMNLDEATRLLQVWGSKQRDIGSIHAIQILKERVNDLPICPRQT